MDFLIVEEIEYVEVETRNGVKLCQETVECHTIIESGHGTVAAAANKEPSQSSRQRGDDDHQGAMINAAAGLEDSSSVSLDELDVSDLLENGSASDDGEGDDDDDGPDQGRPGPGIAQQLAYRKLMEAADQDSNSESQEAVLCQVLAEDQMDAEFQKTQEEKLVPPPARPLLSSLSSSVGGHSGGSSRRDSGNSEGDINNIKDTLYELEDKYKKAMMTNAQLDNEKTSYIYQVDTLKDVLEEQEEGMLEIQRQYKDKVRELGNQKRENKTIQSEITKLREELRIREELIRDNGLVLVGGDVEVVNNNEEEEEEGEGVQAGVVNGLDVKIGSAALLTPEAAELLDKVGDGSLDHQLKKFAEEKKDLLDQIKRLKVEIEDEREKNRSDRRLVPPLSPVNGPDVQLIELQRETSRQINDYKFKLQKAEQDITNLEGNVVRLDGQVKRYKSAAESAEKVEDELKAEKRKLQRELRESQTQIEDLETRNNHLIKRLEKLKGKNLKL